MFPHPPSKTEIAAILRPLLAQCDAAGRQYVIELANKEPDETTISETTQAAMRGAFWQLMLQL